MFVHLVTVTKTAYPSDHRDSASLGPASGSHTQGHVNRVTAVWASLPEDCLQAGALGDCRLFPPSVVCAIEAYLLNADTETFFYSKVYLERVWLESCPVRKAGTGYEGHPRNSCKEFKFYWLTLRS